MPKLVKLLMNGLYESIRKDITEEYKCKSEYCMGTEYDEIVLDYWRLPNRDYIVLLKQDVRLESETDLKNTMPACLATFILSNSKRNNNNFLLEIDGFKKNNVYYSDMDSLYKKRKSWDVIDKTKPLKKVDVEVKAIRKWWYFL